tara:strand:- start:782 stop:1330 length:549 start_codon:yes stop_codon:yes gene_type:complete
MTTFSDRKKENVLKVYSQKLLLEYPEIKDSRKICYIKDIFSDFTDYDELECYPCTSSKLMINISRSETVYCPKFNYEGDSMKWHCDDATIISHKGKNINKYINQIKISEKKSLHYANKIPKFSLIVYGSTYKKDFTGGIFEFSDGTKIKPERNMCILFDSREAHCVHKIKSGKKKLLLIKFY